MGMRQSDIILYPGSAGSEADAYLVSLSQFELRIGVDCDEVYGFTVCFFGVGSYAFEDWGELFAWAAPAMEMVSGQVRLGSRTGLGLTLRRSRQE